MEISGKITLADDSGLEIDYLDKAPGIYSARFLGEDTPYPEKFKVILEKLKDVEEKTELHVLSAASLRLS